MEKQKISIIIPAYNEEKRIGRTLEEYVRYFKDLKSKKLLDFEIIVVINNTKDRTEEIVKKFSRKNKEIRYLNFKRGGKGFAIIEGFKDTLNRDNDLIGFVDADMATPPEEFYKLIKNIGDFGGVIANRWDKRSNISKQTLLRRILSRGFNFIIKVLFLFPYQNTQCGAKLFKREIIEKVVSDIGSSEWSFDIDLLFHIKRKEGKIISIPTKWHDIEGSNINLVKTPIKMFLSVIRLRLYYSPFNFIVRFYGKLPEKMKFQHIL